MRIIKYYIASFVWISFFITACGTSQNCIKHLEEMITVPDVNSWLNLMPGEKGSLHISGEYSFDVKDAELNPSLKKINVSIGRELVYSVFPKVKNKFNKDDVNRDPDKTEMQFFTNPGLNIKEILLSTDRINLEFIFDINGIEIIKRLSDIELTRAY